MGFNSGFKGLKVLLFLPVMLVMNPQQMKHYSNFCFAVALRPNAGHGLLILEVSRSHTTTHHSR